LKIGVFGGRFDPIHIGHLSIIRRLIDTKQVDLIHVVPAADPPHKPVDTTLAHRVSMIEAAISTLCSEQRSKIKIDLRESYRTGASWTYQTLIEISNEYPLDSLWLIIGTDTAKQLHTWKRLDLIFSHSNLLIIERPGHQIVETARYLTTQFRNLPEIIYDDSPPIECDSTSIRNQTRAPLGSIRSIIDEHNLYSASKRIILGITGRVGSGKTTAANYLSTTFQIPIIDLDSIGHILLETDAPKSELISHFGRRILENSHISRQKLGQIVFSDTEQLAALNSIIHPYIRHETVKSLQNSSGNVVIVGALFTEIGIDPLCTSIWVIDAEDSLIESKIGKKFTISRSQRSREEYRQHGSVIPNSFGSEFTETLNREYLHLLNQSIKGDS